jgi:hypothetical protein
MTVVSVEELVEVISPAPRGIWRDLLELDDRARASQTPEWLDAVCGVTGGTDASRLYRWSDGRGLVLPLVRKGSRVASMPRGWGAGGVVSAEPPRRSEVEAVFDDLRDQRFIEVLLRPGPQDADVWSAAAPEGTIRIPHVTHLLDLRGGFELVYRERFSRSTRRNIRKAEAAGLTVVTGPSDALVDEFYDLYLRWTDERARRRHLPRWLARFLARRRESRSKVEGVLRQLGRFCPILTVRDRGTPVAAAIGLLRGCHFTLWRSASHSPTRESKYANVLINKAMIESACASGAVSYDFGESGGVASLMEFKERFGAEPVTYGEYRLERLPIRSLERGQAKVMRAAERLLARSM